MLTLISRRSEPASRIPCARSCARKFRRVAAQMDWGTAPMSARALRTSSGGRVMIAERVKRSRAGRDERGLTHEVCSASLMDGALPAMVPMSSMMICAQRVEVAGSGRRTTSSPRGSGSVLAGRGPISEAGGPSSSGYTRSLKFADPPEEPRERHRGAHWHLGGSRSSQ
jgi:hypothetical protein